MDRNLIAYKALVRSARDLLFAAQQLSYEYDVGTEELSEAIYHIDQEVSSL